MKEFKDKVAVITGAASGIGYGLAEHAAKEGMKVILADVEEKALVKAEKDIRASGADTLAVKTDVSRPDDVKALADKTMEAFGAVHLLCNNAGVSAGSTAWASTLSDWKWVLGVNLWGVIHGIHFFVPIMLKQDNECHIVNTASIAGLISYPSNDIYQVSKHGVVVLSEALYYELKTAGPKIGVSVLCPGYIRTNIMECERNRPVGLKNKPGEEIDISDPQVKATIEGSRQAIYNGMPPQQVAKIVFDAIRDNKFYILPNGDEYTPKIQTRNEDILLQRNPSGTPQPE
jgi:NAD(P)-dependent dehydrogenase (short-subunit alcohol dehydrogenase family)